MPNYEITRKYCNLKKKEVTCPATFVAQPRGAEKLLHDVNDCFSKDAECQKLSCKFAQGDKDPLADLPK